MSATNLPQNFSAGGEPDEVIEELHAKPLKIVQNKKHFCFGIDAILLANFARIKRNHKICELCSGNGIISILLSRKLQNGHIDAVEIQKEAFELAEKSVKINNIEDKISLFNEDLKNAPDFLQKCSYDAVVCNPPYMKNCPTSANKTPQLLIARQEVCCTIDDVAKTSAALLKNGGSLYLIHKADRMADVIFALKSHRLEPKYITFIKPFLGKSPTMFLVESVKDAKSFLKYNDDIIVYSAPGQYTDQMNKIYSEE